MAAAVSFRSTFEPYIKSWNEAYSEKRRSALDSEFKAVLALIETPEIKKACSIYKLRSLGTAIAQAQTNLKSTSVKVQVMSVVLKGLVKRVGALFESSPVTIAHSAQTKKLHEHKSARAELKSHSPPQSAGATPPKSTDLRLGKEESGLASPSRTPSPEAFEKEEFSYGFKVAHPNVTFIKAQLANAAIGFTTGLTSSSELDRTDEQRAVMLFALENLEIMRTLLMKQYEKVSSQNAVQNPPVVKITG